MSNVKSRYTNTYPGLGGPSDIPPTTGARLYVDSGATNASTGADGTTEQPFSTIDSAISSSLCVANRGDQIIVMPGHAENISAATSLVMDKAGVSVFGLGEGNDRPVLTFTATAGSIEMDTASCRLSNLILLASVSEVVVAVNVDANYCIIDHCRFDFDEANDEFDTCIDMTSVDYTKILHNEFRVGATTAGADNVIVAADADNWEVAHNNFSGQWNAVILDSGSAGTQVSLHDNVVYNADTSDNSCFEFTAATTGVCFRNLLGTLGGAQSYSANLDPGSMLNFENYSVNAIDEIALVVPTTTPT